MREGRTEWKSVGDKGLRYCALVDLGSFEKIEKKYIVAGSNVQEKGGSRGNRSAKVFRGGGVLGTITDGKAGGGSGAAVKTLTMGEQV